MSQPVVEVERQGAGLGPLNDGEGSGVEGDRRLLDRVPPGRGEPDGVGPQGRGAVVPVGPPQVRLVDEPEGSAAVVPLIGGVEFYDLPDTQQVPVVADMSSTILSRPIDVSRYGVIYAGAQKNMGIAGLTTVIIREDLIGQAKAGTPAMLDYKTHVDNDSMYNTPPAFSIYMAGLVFKWLKANGGLEAMAKINQHKAQLIYDTIDNSNQFYRSPVAISNRSWMNIPFTLKDDALDKPFLKQAEERGLLQLKGHRSVGGMRASIYNAMPVDGVIALTQFMKEFQKQHG